MSMLLFNIFCYCVLFAGCQAVASMLSRCWETSRRSSDVSVRILRNVLSSNSTWFTSYHFVVHWLIHRCPHLIHSVQLIAGNFWLYLALISLIQWRRSVINLGGSGLPVQATSLPPSILLSSLPSSGLPRGSGQSLLTRFQTFWCNLYSQTAL